MPDAIDQLRVQRAEVVRLMQRHPVAIKIQIAPKDSPTNFSLLYQALAQPNDLTSESAAGSYPRILPLNRSEALSVMNATEGAFLYQLNVVGDAIDTPQLAALLKADNVWQMQRGRGTDFVGCRVIGINPGEYLGWEIVLEVSAT